MNIDEELSCLSIDNQLCFPLYVCSKEVIRKYKPFLDEIDLTYTQYITMLVLWEKETLRVNELGEILYLDSGTLTPLLKSLEKKKLIERNRLDSDERVVMLKLSKQGELLKEKAKHIPLKMRECIDLEKEDVAALYRILRKFMKQLKSEV